MSFQAMAWAIEQRLPTHEKFVLLMLANFTSNERGDCFPSIGRLASDTGLSKDSVERAIKRLEGQGAITVTRRKVAGVNQPNVYRLQMGVAAGSGYPPAAATVAAASGPNQSLNPSTTKKKQSASACASVAFDVGSGKFIGLAEEQLARWAAAFPGTSVSLELDRAACWLICNPTKRPTPGDVQRFLNGWMGRAHRPTARPSTAATSTRASSKTRAERAEEFAAGLMSTPHTSATYVVDIEAHEVN